jgi:hypothetical protein
MIQQPEYIEWPGSATFPGAHTFPGWDDRADGSTTVHAHNLAEWSESNNPLEMAVARLAQATTESAVVRMQNAMGGVNFFYDSTVADTALPPMQGEHVGDVAFGKDHDTGIVYHQYRWDGSAWHAVRVDSEMIANLDVGKLTAGRGDINDLVARRIAAASGKFVELDVGNLTATGTSKIDDLTSQRIWSSVVAAKAVQADQITGDMIAANSIDARKIVAGAVTANQLAANAVTADKIATNAVTSDAIRAGAIDGMVITGAVIQTSRTGARVVINSAGLSAYRANGSQSVFIDSNTGDVTIDGHIGLSDNWSRAYFINVESDAGNPDRTGVGLGFTSKERTYGWPGTVALAETPAGLPYLSLAAPTVAKGVQPHLILSLEQFAVSPRDAAMVLNSGYAAMGNTKKFLQEISPTGFRVYGNGDLSHPMLHSGNDNFVIQKWNGKQVSVWGTDSQIVVRYDAGHYSSWGPNGMSTVGGKNFVMSVPRLSEERGGMMLRHASTESPWDGIEYWQQVVLDADGAGTWTLPDYVPLIASPVAPAVVLCSASSGTAAATLTRGEDEWTVTVSGEPGATVNLLVKAGRILDDPSDGTWYDRSGESLWMLPPMSMAEAEENPPLADDAYGPAMQDAYPSMMASALTSEENA